MSILPFHTPISFFLQDEDGDPYNAPDAAVPPDAEWR
jgi:hypothetical protein